MGGSIATIEHTVTSKSNKINFFIVNHLLIGGVIVNKIKAVHIIAFVNVFIFILMFISGVFSERQPLIQTILFLKFGAQYGPAVSQGDWFRIFTAMFVHGGILHILFNTYALIYFGSIVENIYGVQRFISFYFTSGIIGNLATQVFYYETISVGASGAIFGLIGVLFAAGFRRDTPIFIKHFTGLSLLPIILFNLVYGFIPSSNINNAAHLGGFLAGMIFGYLTGANPYLRRKAKIAWTAASTILVCIVIISFAFLVIKAPEIDELLRILRGF